MAARQPEVAIIGAGMAGICMAIQLQKAGFRRFTLYEKGPRPGGTWRDNTYPGCECDVPSHLYSFSFERKSDWTRSFPGQAEILSYMDHCVSKYGIGPHIQCNTSISEARFDEEQGQWEISLTSGERRRADVLVAAVGQLHKPSTPKIPGAGEFRGAAFHSARWNHNHSLKGRDVGVIGNAASALQLIPEVAKEARRLTVFQRTPNWVVPKPARDFGPLDQMIFKYVPAAELLYRWSIYWRLEFSFAALHQDSWLGEMVKAWAKRYLKREIKDEELRKKLTPDYPVGCKRLLMSNDYYPALARPNVEVVTEKIERIEPQGVVTADGKLHEMDTLVYATGFETTKFLMPMEIWGRGGRSLQQLWEDGAFAHRGVTVAGFPNFFMLYGPNTNLGHNSILFMIEQEVGYAIQCLKRLQEKGLKYVDTRQEAMDAYNDRIQEEMKDTVWVSGCPSWYQTPSGRVTNNWPYRTARYWLEMKRMRPREHEWVG